MSDQNPRSTLGWNSPFGLLCVVISLVAFCAFFGAGIARWWGNVSPYWPFR